MLTQHHGYLFFYIHAHISTVFPEKSHLQNTAPTGHQLHYSPYLPDSTHMGDRRIHHYLLIVTSNLLELWLRLCEMRFSRTGGRMYLRSLFLFWPIRGETPYGSDRRTSPWCNCCQQKRSRRRGPDDISQMQMSLMLISLIRLFVNLAFLSLRWYLTRRS